MADRIGLRQLRAFHAVMVTGSIGAAAERLNLTQPAISKQLSGLEHALDIRLFNRRSGRATTPTQEGVDYYKAIETTIAGLEDLAPIARTIRERGRKRIRFAATPPVMNSARLMSALHRFLAAHPDTHMSLEVRHRMDIEDWVAARQIDIALALLPSNHPALLAIPFVDTVAVAAMRPDHPLAQMDAVGPKDLVPHTVIFPSRQMLRSRIDAELERSGAVVTAQLESSSALTCCRMAAAGLGVTVCDAFSPTAFSPADLVTRKWTPSVPLTHGALINRAIDVGDTVQSLMDVLKEEFSVRT
ncbi:Regulatory protein NocR, partial [Durusdinium trenchii]